MRAAVYEAFQQPLSIQSVPDPAPDNDGALLKDTYKLSQAKQPS